MSSCGAVKQSIAALGSLEVAKSDSNKAREIAGCAGSINDPLKNRFAVSEACVRGANA